MDGQADHKLPTRIDHTHGLIHEFHRPKEIIIFLLIIFYVQTLLFQALVVYKLFSQCTNFIYPIINFYSPTGHICGGEYIEADLITGWLITSAQ